MKKIKRIRLSVILGYIVAGASIVIASLCAKGQGILGGHTVTAYYLNSPTPVDSRLHGLARYRGGHSHKALLEWQSLTNHAYLIESTTNGSDWRLQRAVISGSGKRSFQVVDDDRKTQWRVELAATYPTVEAIMEVWLDIEPYIGEENFFTLGSNWRWSDGWVGGNGGPLATYWWGIYTAPEPLLFQVTVYEPDGSSCSTFGAINIEN